MTFPRSGSTAVWLNKTHWMVGGGQDGHYEWNALNYAEIYDTTTRTWSEGPNLPERIVGHCFINLAGEDDRIMMV